MEHEASRLGEAPGFEQAAQQATLVDYLHEVEHEAERIMRLERSIDTAIETLPVKMRAVIEALQSLRGIAKVSAVSIMAELGAVSRFAHPRQLMGYSGIVSREHSSGERIRRGAISKAGSAHLRRIVVEAAWAYRHRPGMGATLLARQRDQSAEIKAMAWSSYATGLSGQTRDFSPRQLPTNHDHDGESWHSIHEYQSDEPSTTAAPAAVRLCLVETE